MPMEFAESKKKRKPLPGYAILIIVLGSLSLIGAIGKAILTAQTEQAVKQIQDVYQGVPESSTSFVGVIPASYKGLSLKIPSGWTSETSELEGGLLHQLEIESPDVDLAYIIWAKNSQVLPPSEWAQMTHDSLGDEYDEYSASDISKTTFSGNDAYTFDFSYKKLGFKFYCNCIMFEKDGYGVGVLTQSDLRSHLSSRFGFIEETLVFE